MCTAAMLHTRGMARRLRAPWLQVVGSVALLSNGIVPESTWLFGSTAAVWSQEGAAHYSASNCYLTALARSLRAAGHAATTVHFGPFADVGMAASMRCTKRTMFDDPCPTMLQQALTRACPG
jgi:hypothetical protein